MSNDQNSTRQRGQKLLDVFGPIASPLKARLVLPAIILVGATVAVLSTRLWLVDGKSNPAWTPFVIVLGVCAAISVFLDRVADAYDSRAADLDYLGSEYTAESSVNELNSFQAEAIEVSFLEQASRTTALQALRRHLVRSAANSIGPGTRATYYTLQPFEPGSRILGDPQHFVTVGRGDKPPRPFIEKESPHHDVWRILDGPDEHPEVKNDPEIVNDLIWGQRPYKTFLSVPVKARGVVFGLLSVNNATAGSIGRTQRATIIAMARAMAVALAYESGSRVLNGRDS